MKCFSISVVVIAILYAPYLLPDPPLPTNPSELPTAVQEWFKRGRMVDINGHKIFYIQLKCSNRSNKSPSTFAILHGFPSSSFDYHEVIDDLTSAGNVILHDHLGFGLSDKPVANFTYSLSEAAENTLEVWRKAGIKNAHVVAHDMGDSILTEILARRHRGMLPSYFESFFKSVTFTNGGMKYSMIKFRISQTLLSNVYFGSYFSKLSNRFYMAEQFSKMQLQSVWGPNIDVATRDKEIHYTIQLCNYRGGSLIFPKTIYYLWDRANFEFRWFAALKDLDIKVRFVWSDADAVSPLSIPNYFKQIIPHMEMSIINDAGHFVMLEKPSAWIDKVIKPLI